MKVRIFTGDCRDVMQNSPECSIDAIVCDPPYGLSFMGKGWDHGVPGVEFWTEALRVLKPGGHLLAFGGTRTFHRLAVAIEGAGFEIRDCLSWLYGSGFPKSLDVSKAIDKAAGAERKVVGDHPYKDRGTAQSKQSVNLSGSHERLQVITAPATPEAECWQGWGTALKPAWEPIIMARKPLSERTVAANVLAHGTGGINVDGCRIGRDPDDMSGWSQTGSKASDNRAMSGPNYARNPKPDNIAGRWPSNVVLDECAAVILDSQTGVQKGGFVRNRTAGARPFNNNGADTGYVTTAVINEPDAGASRFFYVAKASRRERNAGLEGMPERMVHRAGHGNNEADHGTQKFITQMQNHHPTVKPIALMRWLVRMVTPPGGLILDPFMGSGSTGIAAVQEGFRFIGIELSAEYCEIADKRIQHSIMQLTK